MVARGPGDAELVVAVPQLADEVLERRVEGFRPACDRGGPVLKVPRLTRQGVSEAGFHTLAWTLTGFVPVRALLGLLFAPSNAGKSLDDQRERGGDEDDELWFTRRKRRGRGSASTPHPLRRAQTPGL